MCWAEAHLLALLQEVSGHPCAVNILPQRKQEAREVKWHMPSRLLRSPSGHQTPGSRGQSESEMLTGSTVRILPNHSADPQGDPSAKVLRP